SRAEHGLLAPLIARIEEERGGVRLAIDDEDGARFHDAAHVEELIALAQRLFAGTLGSALQDGDTVADPFHYVCAPRGVLLGGKDVGEYRLRKDGCGETQAEKEFHGLGLL